MKRYLLFLVVMLAINWVLGALQTVGIIPVWSFLLFNFPFGLPCWWLESHWTGTQYTLGGGQPLNETWSLVAWLFAVVAQAWLYSALYGWWRPRSLPATA